MFFKDFALDERLLDAADKAGFVTPTPIQEKAIPICLEGSDLIGTAATGTGKTAAFVFPILNKILHGQPSRTTQALIVTPTRELAEQVNSVIKILSRGTRIRSTAIYGGVGFDFQRRALTDGTEIIVCCPGRMLDHIDQRNTRLENISTVVLDEADRMLDMGFLPDIKRILDKLPVKRQTLLFSATFEPALLELIKHYLQHPKHIKVNIELPAETIDHCFYPVPNHLKFDLLVDLLRTLKIDSVLVFTRTKHRADKVMDKLKRSGFTAGALHSNRSQSQRKQALDGFRSGKIQVLVATDIAARGLDIETISHVVNLDIPDTATTYIHRIGRTGRAEKSGDAITFITPEDRGEVRDIERKLGTQVEKKKLEGFDYNRERPVGQKPEGASYFHQRNERRYPSHSQHQGHPQHRSHGSSSHGSSSGHPQAAHSTTHSRSQSHGTSRT